MADALRKKLRAHARKGFSTIEASAADMAAIYAAFQDVLYSRLDRFVRNGTAGFSGRAAVALREEVEGMFPALTEAWYESVRDPVSYLTQSYYRQALSELSAGKSTGVVGGFNKQRLKLALEEDYSDIAGATRKMSETAVRNLRDVTARVNREANVTGASRREVSKRIYNELGGPEFVFTDRSGRAWDGKSYTEMLGRTMLHNNARKAYLDGCTDSGSDLVRISVSGSPCPKCAVWENRLLSISGTHPKYPALEEATAAGLFHPNCTHRMVAVPAGTAKRKYDADGRPLDGVNAAGNEQLDTPEAWKQYRAERIAMKSHSTDTTPTKKITVPKSTYVKPETQPEFIEAIREEPVECLGVFDPETGKRVGFHVGDERNVRLQLEGGITGKVIIHNHPNGTSFSVADITGQIPYRPAEMILPGKNGTRRLKMNDNGVKLNAVALNRRIFEQSMKMDGLTPENADEFWGKVFEGTNYDFIID